MRLQAGQIVSAARLNKMIIEATEQAARGETPLVRKTTERATNPRRNRPTRTGRGDPSVVSERLQAYPAQQSTERGDSNGDT